jgi:hypothetical protein
MKNPSSGSAEVDVLVVAGYVLLSLGQLAAIHAGVTRWMHFGDLQALLVSVPLAIFPGAGGIVASLGAISAWGWSGLSAFGIFLGLLALIALYMARSGLVKVALRLTDED